MLAPMIPDNAPFSQEQRAWLNGFFAGLLSLDGSPALGAAAPALGDVPAIGAFPTTAADPLADGDDGEAPWHDPTIPLVERMKLAEGRPLRRRLMAAMAQQDCGQCGYNCQDYVDAVFLRTEKRLNLCVPGGKETQRMLKALYAEMDGGAFDKSADNKPAAVLAQTVVAASAPGPLFGYFREAPTMVAFCGALDPLQPRPYSMASSPKAMPGRLHLTVDAVRYSIGDRQPWVSRPPFSRIASGPATRCRPTSSPRTTSACLPIRPRRSSWSVPAPVSLPFAPSCTNAGRSALLARLGCSSATSGARPTFSTRTSSRPCWGRAV